MDICRSLHRLAVAGRRLQQYCVLLGQARTFTGTAGCSLHEANKRRVTWAQRHGQRQQWILPLHSSTLSRHTHSDTSQATLASVAPVFSVVLHSVLSFKRSKPALQLAEKYRKREELAVKLMREEDGENLFKHYMKFDKEGNILSFERKKTELYQELGLHARDLRFQHLVSINSRNNKIILRMEFVKAVITSEYLLILDYRNLHLEQWFLRELAPQLAGEGQLVTYSLPFEFRALEAILQHRISTLQGRLHFLQPRILETLEALVDPKLLSIDRSKLHILLQNGKTLSELETDIKVFKEAILEILDEDELIEELCLTKLSDPQALEESTSRIDLTEEMELLLENYYRQAEDLANVARELRVLIDDSESVIFINLDSHRNVMMRLNLQLTMGTFSLSLFGLIGVAFGMNLESSFEEVPQVFWFLTGIMFLGSGLIWRRLLSFLGRHLEPSKPPSIWKRAFPFNGGGADATNGHKV